MTYVQLYIGGLILLTALILIISSLNEKYRLQKAVEEKKINCSPKILTKDRDFIYMQCLKYPDLNT